MLITDFADLDQSANRKGGCPIMGRQMAKGLTHCMSMLQEDTVVFRSREHYPPTMAIQERLTDVDWGHVALCGLEHVHEWPDLRAHSAQLSALIERWHTPTGSFHLPTGEATVTLLDVW